MTDYKTIRIEQDPKCEERFRITLSEEEIGLSLITEDTRSIYGHEDTIRSLKSLLGYRARDMLIKHPAYLWAVEHGGNKNVNRITYRPKDTGYYRAGLSITFYERGRAALFKLSYVGR